MRFQNVSRRFARLAVYIPFIATAALAQPPRRPPVSVGEPVAALPARRQPTDLVVVAPHPDDEALIASGLMLRAKQAGQRVAVIVMTNGDFDCRADGLLRQRESIEGLSELGVDERDVYFLGYPDGHLARLGRTPLHPVPRQTDGACTSGTHTYGNRGHSHSDFHYGRYGSHAVYTAAQAVGDLAAVLQELAPARLAVTHPNDSHPDHAATYSLVRRALKHLPRKPELLRALVHTGDCWPTGDDPKSQCQPGRIAPGETVPPLTGALTGYQPNLRLPVPQDCLTSTFDSNPKLRAIGAHRSQTHGDHSSYLFAFARAEEVFFSETLERESKPHPVLLRTTVPSLASNKANNKETPRAFRAASGDYGLEISVDSVQVAVWRNTPRGEQQLHRWPLAHDVFTRETPFEVTVEHVYPDDTAELGVYASGQLVGVTVVVGSGLWNEKSRAGEQKGNAAPRIHSR